MRGKSVRLILHQCPEDPSETVLFRISAGDVRNCVVQTVLRIVERYAVEPEKDVPQAIPASTMGNLALAMVRAYL